MKILVLIFAFALGLNSCAAPKMYQITGDCKPTTEEVFRTLTSIAVSEGFNIKISDSKIGLMQIESSPAFDFLNNAETQNTWTFRHDSGKLIATAKRRATVKNAFGATLANVEAYWQDETTNKEWLWYWNVRNGLDKICGVKFVITEKPIQQ